MRRKFIEELSPRSGRQRVVPTCRDRQTTLTPSPLPPGERAVPKAG